MEPSREHKAKGSILREARRREGKVGRRRSWSMRVYRENEGSRSRLESLVEMVAIYNCLGREIFPARRGFLSASHSSRLPFRSSLPFLAPLRVITSEMKEKRPGGKSVSVKGDPFYYMRPGRYPDRSQTTFYPEQPRKTGQLVFLHFHRASLRTRAAEEDEGQREKSRL